MAPAVAEPTTSAVEASDHIRNCDTDEQAIRDAESSAGRRHPSGSRGAREFDGIHRVGVLGSRSIRGREVFRVASVKRKLC